MQRSSAGAAATDVILATFRANGLLVSAGDRLTKDLGLTAARWQVLGALALADRPLTVPQIARRMGLTRQSVHATIDRLAKGGLVELRPNADHRRSQLVHLTPSGRRTYAAVDRRQAAWVNELAKGNDRASLETAAAVLDRFAERLASVVDEI